MMGYFIYSLLSKGKMIKIYSYLLIVDILSYVCIVFKIYYDIKVGIKLNCIINFCMFFIIDIWLFIECMLIKKYCYFSRIWINCFIEIF